MLDADVLEQLRAVFLKLENNISLKIFHSAHADQALLLEMLNALATTSEKIKVILSPETKNAPHFELFNQNRFTGISFTGIPNGHEFSSLILSILYADKKGKQPDEALIRRIQAIQGPIRLKTYISLTCENCPEVVQALNLMASLHSDFHHEMIDGAVAQADIDRLGIQGVPAVYTHTDRLIQSGKTQLIDLLNALEKTYGTENHPSTLQQHETYDMAVIGAGPAGVSSAIYSARKGLKTVIIAEKIGGQLQQTRGIENMISIPYTEGPQLAAQLSAHLAAYPVKILDHRRVQSIENSSVKKITLEGGESILTQAIIIATGAKWRELGIPGEKEYIGRGVAFCAHCDGPFYKDKKVIVVGAGNSGIEAAIDLSGIAKEVTVIEFSDTVKADGVLVKKLKSMPHTKIITQAKLEKIIGNDSKVTAVEYTDRPSKIRKTLEIDGVFIQIGLTPHSSFVKELVKTNANGEILVDDRGRTSAPGIYAAGDVTPLPFKQIITAMGDGAKVALSAFEDSMRKTETRP